MVIYKTTNLINGRQYIGKDSKNNPNYLGSGAFLKRAIQKYGKENFKKEILEVCSSQQELTEREEYWLNYYNAGNNPIFYNMHNHSYGAPSGESNHMYGVCGEKHPLFGIPRSDETRKKLSVRQLGEKHHFYGKNLSKEHREKLSEAIRGEKCFWYGKKRSDSARIKMSESHRGEKNPNFGKQLSDDHKRKIGESQSGEKNHNFKGYVVCTSGVYIGMKKTSKEWCEILGVNKTNFHTHLSGKWYKKGIRGNSFKWENEINE